MKKLIALFILTTSFAYCFGQNPVIDDTTVIIRNIGLDPQQITVDSATAAKLTHIAHEGKGYEILDHTIAFKRKMDFVQKTCHGSKIDKMMFESVLRFKVTKVYFEAIHVKIPSGRVVSGYFILYIDYPVD